MQKSLLIYRLASSIPLLILVGAIGVSLSGCDHGNRQINDGQHVLVHLKDHSEYEAILRGYAGRQLKIQDLDGTIHWIPCEQILKNDCGNSWTWDYIKIDPPAAAVAPIPAPEPPKPNSSFWTDFFGGLDKFFYSHRDGCIMGSYIVVCLFILYSIRQNQKQKQK